MLRKCWNSIAKFFATPEPVVPTTVAPKAKQATGIQFDPDHAIGPQDKDELGFRAVAENLAKSLRGSSIEEGLVIGIEGAWGSGKSSILKMLCALLPDDNTSVIPFDPWIVGDRDKMVGTLMHDLAKAVEDVERELGLVSPAKAHVKQIERVSDLLRGYGAATMRGLSPAVKLASLFGVPYIEHAGKALDEAAKALEKTHADQPLSAVKSKLTKGLRDLQHRFVVVVDDLDRLEPKEVAEVVRLVRAVADFPNVAYLLCYDTKVLSHSLESSLGVPSGRAFLDKIVQVTFPVPRPEEFDLRRWFLTECHLIYANVRGRILDNNDEISRLSRVTDTEGSLLITPRDVKRVLNALKLFYPPVADRVDFADMCWLQITRLKRPKLYRWVERYLGIVAAVALSKGRPSSAERSILSHQIKEYLPEGDVGSYGSLHRFADIIPGIDPLATEEIKTIFNETGQTAQTALERDHRLASAHHYRFYFSFSRAAGALDDAVLQSIREAVEAGRGADDLLRSLIDNARPQGGTMYEVVLDRLVRDPPLSFDTGTTLISAVLDTADVAQASEPRPEFFSSRMVWRSAAKLFALVLAKAPQEKRRRFITETFAQRKAIGCLLGEIIGGELFAHGRVGSQTRPEKEWVFQDGELNLVIAIMLQRLSEPEDRARIIEIEDLLAFLFRWEQSGGAEDMRKWISEISVSDDGFLHLLEKCRSWAAIGSRVYRPLNRREVEHLMDFDAALNRLRTIARDPHRIARQRDQANELLQASEIEV